MKVPDPESRVRGSAEADEAPQPWTLVPGPLRQAQGEAGTARPFLTDFGLAKSVATGSKLTRTGEALGTPAYMSPEQARGEVSALTPATDVWSLGCVLYEMLAGRPAFEGETAAAVVGQVLLRDPPALRTLRPETPRAVEGVVRVCLGKRAGDRSAWLAAGRYGDAAALREDLERVLGRQSPRARLPGARRRAWAALASVGAVAATWAGTALRPEVAAPQFPTSTQGESEAERLAARARALRQPDPREAARLLGEALAADPSREDWRIERGLVFWAIGRGPEAREEWGTVGEASPARARARLYRGLEAFFRLAGPEALPDLEAAANGTGSMARLAKGTVELLEERWGGARPLLAGETGWESALLRGYLESADPAGDPGTALRELGKAIEEGFAFAWAHVNRGQLRSEQGDDAGAIEDYTRAIELDPLFAEAYRNRGAARQARGEMVEALVDLDRAIVLDPRDALTYYNRGTTRSHRGDTSGAVRDYDRAIELDPRFADAYTNRGFARRSENDPRGAIADWRRALEVAPPAWPYREKVTRYLAEAVAAEAGDGR